MSKAEINVLTIRGRQYINVAEAMRRYGYSRQHVALLLNKANGVTSIKIGNMRWIDLESLTHYFQERGRSPEKRKPRKVEARKN
jgi:hypothetical protein